MLNASYRCTDPKYAISGDGRRGLSYDERRWARDTTNEVKRRAIDTMRAFYRQAASFEGDRRDAAEKHARQSEQGRAIREMLGLAPAFHEMTLVSTGARRKHLF